MIVNYRTVKCDNCGKEEVVKGLEALPKEWFTTTIYRIDNYGGYSVFEKEVCCEKCMIELLHNIKEIPKVKIISMR